VVVPFAWTTRDNATRDDATRHAALLSDPIVACSLVVPLLPEVYASGVQKATVDIYPPKEKVASPPSPTKHACMLM
jgi:hypothetical protein